MRRARQRVPWHRIVALLVLGIIVGHATMMTSALTDHRHEVVGDVMPVRAMAVSMTMNADGPISVSNAPGEIPGHHPDACGVLLEASTPSHLFNFVLPSLSAIGCTSTSQAHPAIPATGSSEPGQPPEQLRARIQIWRM